MAFHDLPRRPRHASAALALSLAAAFALALASAPAGAKKPKKSAEEPDIADYSDDALAKRFQLPLTEVGYLVVDARTGQVLEQRQAKDGFVPASTIKVVSTVAALVVLGHEHRFQTELLATGAVANGTLAGDLFLKGGGDPMLTSDDFESMAQQLRAKGVTRVGGRFVYDSSAYVTAKAIDAEYEESAAYNPGIAALSVNFNVLQLKWEREKKGETRYRFAAQTDNHELDVNYLKAEPAQPGTTGPYGLAYRDDAKSPTWLVIPAKRPKGEIRVPVKRPDFNAAYVFRKAAEKHGIALPEPVAGAAPDAANPLVRLISKPLPDIVYRTQRFSNNMSAEMLSLAAARKLTGRTLDLAAAGQVVSGWLKEKISGVDWTGLNLRNGSGLTKDSRISPEQMVAVLRYAQKLAIGNQIYADLLRRYNVGKVESEEEYGHEEGSRQNGREKGAKRGVEIKAKTGTVNYSRGVVGYLHTGKGRDVVFAVFISDYKQREAMQKQGQAWKEPPVRWWLSRSREFQRALVKRWAEKL
ncbi:MAG: D-alanyl-D-alanine carboxypeptidase/D-alanyl-D-alanine-endopeptidase [Candidatus Odyssella sp.]|nr:D-alanyl-D-alanine carboxypeptidase/D-alanyl-D-alanine-endopeptidase [Candidatus Odyssella sp.]